MWFLNTTTRRLEAFNNERDIRSGYAVLSLRWAEDEVTFDEIHLPESRTKQGYRKIDFACNQAAKDGYEYIWIDTCCIDKRSSAELSEAINSMFHLYHSARACYVCINDFQYQIGFFEAEATRQFQNSVWWSRGWTLQELLAPVVVQFYDYDWRFYGSKAELIDTIHHITKIDVQVLKDPGSLPKMSVAKRMSWAARRATSREEDQACSLLGIFNVNMPLLYGEGGIKGPAFYRLQEEIVRTSSFAEHSILAWMTWEGPPLCFTVSSYAGYTEPANYQKLLAPSPYGFRHAHDIVSWGLPQAETFSLTSRGLRWSLFVQPISRTTTDTESVTAILNCRYADQRMSYIILWLDERRQVDEVGFQDRPRQEVDDMYDRSHRRFRFGTRLQSLPASDVQGSKIEVTLAREPFVWPHFEDKLHVTARFRDKRTMAQSERGKLHVVETFPADAFDSEMSILSLTTSPQRYNKNMRPAYGALVFGNHVQQPSDFVLIIDRLSTGNQSPRLLADLFTRSQVSNLADLPMRTPVNLVPDKTCSFDGMRLGMVQVTARSVIVSGELFWSIHVFQDLDG